MSVTTTIVEKCYMCDGSQNLLKNLGLEFRITNQKSQKLNYKKLYIDDFDKKSVLLILSVYTTVINMRYKNISKYENNLNINLISRGLDPISLFFTVLNPNTGISI